MEPRDPVDPPAGSGPGLLHELEPGLWVHDGVKRFCGLWLHRWMTVVRLTDGGLFVHSPNEPGPRLRAELEALGPVRCVVAPNRLHSHAMDEMARAYPQATFFGAPGLRRRHPRLRVDRVLGDRPEPEWEEDLDQCHLAGNPLMEEVLFLHRASRTLIVTDFLENIHREQVGLGWRIGCAVFGLWQRVAPAPEHALYTLDASAFEAALARVRAFRFDRILLAHGRFIEVDAEAVFDEVATSVLRRAHARGPLRRGALRCCAWLEDQLIP